VPKKTIAIIGGGPAGLMAAELLSARGFAVCVYDRKPSVGRKFLMAGRGGLNLTHSEDLEMFISRYGAASNVLSPIINAFTPQNLRDWCDELGEKTFIGSSGRVFPESFKASPLLRAWIKRLEDQGVKFLLGHDWQGWDQDLLAFETAGGLVSVQADATLLALGGASWPRLGSDGSWVDTLQKQHIKIAPLRPANCGFCVAWSDVFRTRFAGQPLKPVTLKFQGASLQGEILITDRGVEGGAIYALSALLREAIYQHGSAPLELDLKPALDLAQVTERLKKSRGRDSLSNHLRKTLNLSPVAIGLLMEHPDRQRLNDYTPAQMAGLIKQYPLNLTAPFLIERAISTAGGVMFESLDENFMLNDKPGVFIAGEMLDWEAPTGGYLLQATMATAAHAANGLAAWLSR
jgi:uncharacterized flavoprotein (TIGR03862 family)